MSRRPDRACASCRYPAECPEGDSVPHIDILVLAIIQGVTQFLPVGASGHAQLLATFFCWNDADPAIGLGRELGLILALSLYFWRDVVGLGQGLWQVVRRKRDPRSRLLGYLVLGGIPSAVISVGLELALGDTFGNPWLVPATLIGFGLLLYLADRLGLTVRRIEHLNMGTALLIGLVQCLDIVPGVSRVGIALTTGRFLGFERLEAVRFALLLGLPSGVVFALYRLSSIVMAAAPLDWSSAVLALVCTWFAGFLAISFLMYWLRRSDVAPFALYRLGLGLYVLYQLYHLSPLNC
jgi:undecaprenyl-diphosphatase